MLLKLEIYLSISAPNDMDTFGSRNFGHKSYKIILNKKPLILYIFFAIDSFTIINLFIVTDRDIF